MDGVMSDPNYPSSPFGHDNSRDPYSTSQTPYNPYGQPAPVPEPRQRAVTGGPVMSARRQMRMKNSKIRRNLLIGISVFVGLLLALIATDTIKLGTGPRPKLADEVVSQRAPQPTTQVAGEEVEAIRTPTPDNPLRVYIAGDSLTGSYGSILGTDLGETGVISAKYDSRPSSGLVNIDFFNWYKHSRTIMSSFNPEIIIFMIGTNDASIVSSNPKDYVSSYSEDLNDVLDIFEPENRKVFFVLAPAMKDSRLNSNVTKLNYVIKSVATARRARVIDANESLSPSYRYTSRVKQDGKIVSVRSTDGVHISGEGGELLSQQIYDTLERLFFFSEFAGGDPIAPTKVKGCCSIASSAPSNTARSLSSTSSTSSSTSSSSSSSTTSPTTPELGDE